LTVFNRHTTNSCVYHSGGGWLGGVTVRTRSGVA